MCVCVCVCVCLLNQHIIIIKPDDVILFSKSCSACESYSVNCKTLMTKERTHSFEYRVYCAVD